MKTKQELLSELFLTCVDLNCKTFTVFFDYIAHVNRIEVKVFERGWKPYASYEHIFFISTNNDFNEKHCQELINELTKIKAESELKANDKNHQLQKRKEELLEELDRLESEFIEGKA